MNNEIRWFRRVQNRKRPGKQNISRVETNYSPGTRKVKLSLGRLNWTTGSVIKGCNTLCFFALSLIRQINDNISQKTIFHSRLLSLF